MVQEAVRVAILGREVIGWIIGSFNGVEIWESRKHVQTQKRKRRLL